jgi:hypothetical protein
MYSWAISFFPIACDPSYPFIYIKYPDTDI